MEKEEGNVEAGIVDLVSHLLIKEVKLVNAEENVSHVAEEVKVAVHSEFK